MTRFLLTCAAFALALPAFAQAAQPLSALAPAETVLTLGYKTTGESGSNALKDDLAELDWAGAKETLEQLATLLGASDSESAFGDASGGDTSGGAGNEYGDANGSTDNIGDEVLGGLLDSLSAREAGQTMLSEACPELLEESFKNVESGALDALLTVSVSPFNPVPAATALLRIKDEEVASIYAEMQEVIVRCAERGSEVVRLEQGDIPLYVVGDGSNFPVIIGHLDDLFFAGSNPEAVRGVVRRAQGNSEANLAGGRLYGEASDILEVDGVSVSLNVAGLAQIAENFGGLFVDGPDMEAAFERGLAILRTIEGFAGSVRATSAGLESESLTAVNPDGGDAELADLLLCETCAVSSPFLAPETSVGVSAQYVAWKPIFDYLQGVLDDLEPLVGESLDIKAILREELGLDLDTALFDWLGNEVYSVVLEPSSADLGTLFYGSAQAFYVPVTSREAAEAGLGELAEVAKTALEATDDMDIDEFSSQFTDIATETYTYEDVEVTRYRSGINTDIGVAFLGNYLVVGTPAETLESLIDTFNGGEPSILAKRSFREALSNQSEEVVARSYSESGVQLAGLADLSGLFSQPLAFAANLALAEMTSANAQPSYAELLTLTDLLPEALSITAERVGTTSGYTEVRDGALYGRSTLQIDW